MNLKILAILTLLFSNILYAETQSVCVDDFLNSIFKENIDSESKLAISLKSAPFAQDKYSKKILRTLQETGAREASLSVTGKNKSQLIKEWKKVKFKSISEKTIVVKPDVFFGNAAGYGSNDKVLKVAGTFVEEGKDVPLGFFVLAFPEREAGKVKPYLELIKFDTANAEIKGMSSKLIPSVTKFLQESGFKNVELEADWMGRVVWAKRGFDFNPAVKLYKNGEAINQIDLARENLTRFLDANDMKITDLEIVDSNFKRTIVSAEELKIPLDFVNLVHKKGRKITFSPYIDEGVYHQLSEGNVGVAFSLGGYAPREGQSVKILGFDGDAVSDQALFNWQGVLNIEP
jgi:hypothetical protein